MARRHDAKGRTKNPGGQFFALPKSMSSHPAFRALSGPAVKVWIELRSRFTVRGDGTSNNGELSLSFAQATQFLGLGRATVARAFAELEASGFIVKTKDGHWWGRQATQWRVTDAPYKRDPPSRDWQKLPPASAPCRH